MGLRRYLASIRWLSHGLVSFGPLLAFSASTYADCEPIRILDDSVSSAREVILTDTFDVMEPGPNQIQMVREADKRMTPMPLPGFDLSGLPGHRQHWAYGMSAYSEIWKTLTANQRSSRLPMTTRK